MQRASQIIGRLSAVPKRPKDTDPLLNVEEIACAAWARASGKKISQHTRAAKLVRGRLIVEVEDATWQRQLFALSKHITSNLEKQLGPGIVSEIEFRILPRRREPQRAESLKLEVTSSDEADAIQDPGMRRLYQAARRKEAI